MTRQEKKEELIGLFAVGAIFIGDLIDECIDFGQQQPCWISVEDELPKDDAYVVTINKVGLKEVRHFYHDKWFSSFGNEYGDVTHWMPIPQPPVVSKSENIGKKGGEQIIGTAEHIKVALDVLDKKGGEE
jgi:hypothetical protein